MSLLWCIYKVVFSLGFYTSRDGRTHCVVVCTVEHSCWHCDVMTDALAGIKVFLQFKNKTKHAGLSVIYLSVFIMI